MTTVVAEFNNPKMTGMDAMNKFAEQQGREIDQSSTLPIGHFRFVDGVKTYAALMFSGGWRIVVVSDF